MNVQHEMAAWRREREDHARALSERDARIAELEKDAARYRWLKSGDNCSTPSRYPIVVATGPYADDLLIRDELDAAIDAALSAKEQSK